MSARKIETARADANREFFDKCSGMVADWDQDDEERDDHQQTKAQDTTGGRDPRGNPNRAPRKIRRKRKPAPFVRQRGKNDPWRNAEQLRSPTLSDQANRIPA
jgi:hypothetical protein